MLFDILLHNNVMNLNEKLQNEAFLQKIFKMFAIKKS